MSQRKPDATRFAELTRQLDGSALLGYLNYSDGRPDGKFRAGLAAAAHAIDWPQGAWWETLIGWLLHRADELEKTGSAAFHDLARAKQVALVALTELPQAYLRFHSTLLAHAVPETIFNSFFLARCCEATLSLEEPSAANIEQVLPMLNDFVGYRPMALLEGRPETEFYPKEKICPVPIYFSSAGFANDRYTGLIRPALELLRVCDAEVLQAAGLDPSHLDEIAFDPRAIDHFHPVNKRPSVLFGEWDPHTIDDRGYFRRFVLRQGTLDALLRWVNSAGQSGTATNERLFEAGAAICGTILMGAGVSGAGPSFHDSTVTLTALVRQIAHYRDRYYQGLLAGLHGSHGERLRKEAEAKRQPFATVRQYLNQSIASERALHLQERHLALFFAAMGYGGEAREHAECIPAPSSRLLTEIRLLQTEFNHQLDEPTLDDGIDVLAEIERLLKEGIDCGALIDPWNILGFQGLFPIFPGPDDVVRDLRADELIDIVARQFQLYARALAAAAATGTEAQAEQFRRGMCGLAQWWDRYATVTVADVPHLHGGDRSDSAEHVAHALALWKSEWSEPADESQTSLPPEVGFWRQQLEGFRTPAAFAQVISALLRHRDHRGAQALLTTWLSESHSVALQDASASYHRLAHQWVESVLADDSLSSAEQATLIRRFLELIEANADEQWQVPELPTWSEPPRPAETTIDEDDDDDDRDQFSSAYEGVTYQDSTDDGTDSSLAEGGPPSTEGFSLEGDAESMESRLQFLEMIAQLWQRIAAEPRLWQASNNAVIDEWSSTARRNAGELFELCVKLSGVAIPDPISGVESVMEFDRRRSIKTQLLELIIQTGCETVVAARGLQALLRQRVPIATEKTAQPRNETRVESLLNIPWEPLAGQLEQAVIARDPAQARARLRPFLQAFQHEPLLIRPLSDGGDPIRVARTQLALQLLSSLLERLPKLGLIRETFQLIRLARKMERNNPPEVRRVSSFDRLFQTAVEESVAAVLASSSEWNEAAAEDGPLAEGLQELAEAYQTVWIDHSNGLRLSALEAVLEERDWQPIREFIEEYGADLFTVQFLTLANLRGILGQGVAAWLDREAQQTDDDRPVLIDEWANDQLNKSNIIACLEIVLQALVDHYDEYRDYNTTTTQSDYGENIYILLDMLRLKVAYDRYAWRLKPMILTHERLCRHGFDRLAAKWYEFLEQRTHSLAGELLTKLEQSERDHAVRLQTIRDRLEERFVQSLRVDQAVGRVERANNAARDGQDEDNPALTSLLRAIQPLAARPTGVGLDVPDWLERLEDELQTLLENEAEPYLDRTANDGFGTIPLSLEEFQNQLRDLHDPLIGN